ncbi:saccharopine dehydrogenase NADP-binding domain-containing protein [Nibrella saemangeumensis]|uniref:Saccharopine dehydrogenase NADP-binding domain-containing protein n=1 Tax=Nibrella saemangeumensis TaxID=1084526 RepID=A0ABP8MHM0_9BACT
MAEVLLYGANGYTAGLIIDLAGSYGVNLILAGRSAEKIKPLAERYGLPYRIADLQDSGALDAILQDVPVVLHCAGPFIRTALPMQQACLRTGTHYLDITGEIPVFEQGVALHQQATDKNIMLMSGVGFDVVPTDCLALYLKQRLPDATHLQLAINNQDGEVSHGTASTVLENLGVGGMVRKDGKLVTVPVAHKTLHVPFEAGKMLMCMTIPWGDLSTAYYTTRIPNIETYMATPPAMIRAAKLSNYLSWLLGSPWFKRFAQRRIDKSLTGPNEQVRQKARSLVWGKAWNSQGVSVQARLEGPEGYTLTAIAALRITRNVLDGHWKPGYQTPASMYGPDLILEVPNTTREDIRD